MLSPMVWSLQRLYSGSQYINQDVDKVKHPSYSRVPLVCITAYTKMHSVMASSFINKTQSAGCFLPIWTMRGQTARRGQALSRELTSQIMPLSLTFAHLLYIFIQQPRGFTFQASCTQWLGLKKKKKKLYYKLFGPLLYWDQPLNSHSVCLWRNLTPLRSLPSGKRLFP